MPRRRDQHSRDYERAYRAANPQKCLAKRLKQYGLTLDSYRLLLDVQGAACAICKVKFDLTGQKVRRPYVDHDHKTGKVRSLLCHWCNLYMAAIDSPRLPELLAYKRLHEEGP